MAQQTAVDWLVNHWKKLQSEGEKMSWQQVIDITELVKPMEREQIEKAFFKGHCDGYNAGVSLYSEVEFQSADQYYNETYGK
jgi:hypothetical protein